MIKEKTLYFGYGDICVGSVSTSLRFQEIEPPKRCGENVCREDTTFKGEVILISFDSFSEFTRFEYFLNGCSDENHRVFEFNGYKFDFTNFNQDSIIAVKHHLEYASKNFLWLCAV